MNNRIASRFLNTLVFVVCFLLLIAAVVWGLRIIMPVLARNTSPGMVAFWLALGLVPGLIVLQHAIILALEPDPVLIHKPGETQNAKNLAAMEPVYESEFRRIVESRSLIVLAARYAIPICILTACAWLALVFVLFAKLDRMFHVAQFPDNIAAGLRFGALGAYVYVLLQLGQRYFQRDVTTGGTIWCAINLLLGPALAAFLAVAWKVSDSPEGIDFWPASAYFLAGLAPRFVADRINDIVRKYFLPQSDAGLSSARTLPLTQIRGITTLIEERLYEEGIFDVFGLAMANPFRLMRRTPFDKRQIACWIDEALLIMFVPEGWKLLEGEGITGVIDLATLSRSNQDPPKDSPVQLNSSISKSVADLAKTVKMESNLLADLIDRLFEDSQVNLIWGLYQFMTYDEAQGNAAAGDVSQAG